MKKKYEYYVNKRNTPNMDLYTILIGLAYGVNTLNFFLAFLYSEFVVKWDDSHMYLILSVIMLVLIPLTTKDPRKGNRGFFAVLCDYIMCTVLTFAMIIFYDMYWLLVIYGIEMIMVLIIIVYHNKYKK